jgi:hypothetical protein
MIAKTHFFIPRQGRRPTANVGRSPPSALTILNPAELKLGPKRLKRGANTREIQAAITAEL